VNLASEKNPFCVLSVCKSKEFVQLNYLQIQKLSFELSSFCFLQKRILEHIFSFMSLTELKSNRLVCKKWDRHITSSPFWTDSVVAVVDCQNSSWLSLSSNGIGTECASFLESSATRFFCWTTMRLRQLQSRHVNPLITHYSSLFRRSVRGIVRLEISSCHLLWTDLLDLIDLFSKLKELVVDKCTFKLEECFVEDMLYQVGITRPLDFNEVIEEISIKCPEKYYNFEELRSIYIVEEDTHSESITPILLTLLKGRVRDGLEDFNLSLGRGTAYLKNTNEQNQYWQCVHSFLESKNILKCHISSRHSVTTGMVNRFLTYLTLWKCEFYRLQELSIDLRPFNLWQSFQRHLIPLLHRMPNLELFSLKNVVLRGNRASFLKEILELQHTSSNCQLTFGVILDDQGGVTASALEKELLSSQVYRDHLISVEVIVQSDAIREVREMIPYSTSKEIVIFPLVEQFTFTTNATARPRFFTFNVNTIVYNFPCLTELKIVDGPSYDYNSFFRRTDGQWNDMSGAMLGDEDLQLIMKNLLKLKVLMLRANMKYMTDAGFTGLTTVYCRRLLRRWADMKTVDVPQDVDLVYREGVDFSRLTSNLFASLVRFHRKQFVFWFRVIRFDVLVERWV
jgi:hypothetical protein